MLRQTFQIATGSRMCSGLAAAKSMRSRAVFLLLAAVVIAVVDAGFQIPMSLLWFCCRWPSFCIPVVLATCNPDCCVLLATSRCRSRLPFLLAIHLPPRPLPVPPFTLPLCSLRRANPHPLPNPCPYPLAIPPRALLPSPLPPRTEGSAGVRERGIYSYKQLQQHRA